MSGASMRTCPTCGNSVPSGARFCPYCGQTMAQAAFCPHCGSPVAPDATFCNTCKQTISNDPSGQYAPRRPPASSNVSTAAHNSATDMNRPIPTGSSGPTFSSTSASNRAARRSEQGNTAATISLVCGIISVVLPLILSGLAFCTIAGLILGIVAVYQANEARDMGVTGGMQTAGFALGIVGICLSGLGLLACIACAGAAGASLGALNSLLQSGGYYY